MNGTTGTVTFDTAPAKPQVVGQDNVEITVTRSDYSDSSIQGCRVMGLFGLGGADTDRIFFTGNPDKPNVDWHCDISAPDYNVDPTYIPDTSFAYIGAEQNPIMGYRRLGAYQVIIKGANDQDASVYLRSAALDIDGNTAFGIQQGAAGQGAVAMKSFANLGDDPLFLGANGIMGISNLDVTALASIQNRSFFVNPLLTQERDLSKAIAVEWRGCYVLSRIFSGHQAVLRLACQAVCLRNTLHHCRFPWKQNQCQAAHPFCPLPRLEQSCMPLLHPRPQLPQAYKSIT